MRSMYGNNNTDNTVVRSVARICIQRVRKKCCSGFQIDFRYLPTRVEDGVDCADEKRKKRLNYIFNKKACKRSITITIIIIIIESSSPTRALLRRKTECCCGPYYYTGFAP